MLYDIDSLTAIIIPYGKIIYSILIRLQNIRVIFV